MSRGRREADWEVGMYEWMGMLREMILVEYLKVAISYRGVVLVRRCWGRGSGTAVLNYARRGVVPSQWIFRTQSWRKESLKPQTHTPTFAVAHIGDRRRRDEKKDQDGSCSTEEGEVTETGEEKRSKKEKTESDTGGEKNGKKRLSSATPCLVGEQVDGVYKWTA